MKNDLGYEVDGHKPVCNCGEVGTCIWRWDTYACMSCKKWLEPACGCDPEECMYAERPEAPPE